MHPTTRGKGKKKQWLILYLSGEDRVIIGVFAASINEDRPFIYYIYYLCRELRKGGNIIIMRIPRLRFIGLFVLCVCVIKLISLDVFFWQRGWTEDGANSYDAIEALAFKAKIIDYDNMLEQPVIKVDPDWQEDREGGDLSPFLLQHQRRRDLRPRMLRIGEEETMVEEGKGIDEEEGVFVVTGGLGNIGMALIKELLSRGIRVRCFDILPKAKVADRLRRFDLPAYSKLFEYVEGDIRNREQVEALVRPVTIVEKYSPPAQQQGRDGAREGEANPIKEETVVSFDKADEPLELQKEVRDPEEKKERRINLIVRGVYHLAGIARKSECGKAPQFCESVNVGGTRVLIDAIKSMSIEKEPSLPSATHHREHLPWLVYVSSHEVTGKPFF